MGLRVTISFDRRPDKTGLTADEAIMLGDRRADSRGLPAMCPDCGAAWEHQTATVWGPIEVWTVVYQCSQGHE
jgi:hypothetical protein